MVRTEPTADDSFAAILERSKLGMAIALIIKIIATTISNSMREKPLCLLITSPEEVASGRRQKDYPILTMSTRNAKYRNVRASAVLLSISRRKKKGGSETSSPLIPKRAWELVAENRCSRKCVAG